MNTTNGFKDIDEYIKSAPIRSRYILEDIRSIIKKAAPEAKEKISYGMPTFTFGKNLVHFAAFKNHIGFYPMPSAIIAFRDELKPYKTSKGAVQFPIDQKIPKGLITKMVRFRLKEVKALIKK